MERLSDEQLVEKYKTGEIPALGFLIKRYEQQLFTYIYKMVRDRNMAEDIFQEAFVRIIKNIDRYEKKDKFKSWIYKISANLVIDNSRRKKRRPLVSLDKTINEDGGNMLTLKDTINDQSPLPEDIVQKKYLKEDLEEAIAALPLDQREVFVLREYSNLSFKEIASLSECSLNTVLGRMHYALKKLRSNLSVKYGEKTNEM